MYVIFAVSCNLSVSSDTRNLTTPAAALAAAVPFAQRGRAAALAPNSLSLRWSSLGTATHVQLGNGLALRCAAALLLNLCFARPSSDSLHTTAREVGA